jgi:hypothetical protein
VFFAAVNGSGEPRALVVNLPAKGSSSVTTLPFAEVARGALAAQAGETREQAAARVCAKLHYAGPWDARLEPLLREACVRSVLDNGHTLARDVAHNVPRAMFVFLPLFALVMTLMYWWPRRLYVEHLLLLVHDQSFVFVLFVLYWTLELIAPAGLHSSLGWAVALYIPYYLYRSMRRLYGQGRLLTGGKLIVLLVAYVLAGFVTLVGTFIYSAVTM